MKPNSRKALAAVPDAVGDPRPLHAPAPDHLSAEATTWWQSVVRDYEMGPHHLRLLQSAAEAWDRMQQARQSLADHGALIFKGANGDLKTHPAVAIERDARIAFARLVRELDLDASPPAERGRPPSLHSNRRQ